MVGPDNVLQPMTLWRKLKGGANSSGNVVDLTIHGKPYMNDHEDVEDEQAKGDQRCDGRDALGLTMSWLALLRVLHHLCHDY